MDHTQFKANQTAAVYVAEGLDELTQEAFELHMMGCPECVDDVEVWRAIKLDMPRPSPARIPASHDRGTIAGRGAINTRGTLSASGAARVKRFSAFADWRVAASLLVAAGVGAAGGWLGGSAQSADLDSSRTVVFNVPAVMRGAGECTPLALAADTRVAALRVPGVSRDLHVVALDSDKRELPTGRYASRIQPDGSQLVRIDSELLAGRAVRLEARHPDGSSEPLGCVSGETSAH